MFAPLQRRNTSDPRSGNGENNRSAKADSKAKRNKILLLASGDHGHVDLAKLDHGLGAAVHL
ncbi:MAG: hypothetical protein ACK4ZJ_07285, partial [Allorhizobium sp.]